MLLWARCQCTGTPSADTEPQPELDWDQKQTTCPNKGAPKQWVFVLSERHGWLSLIFKRKKKLKTHFSFHLFLTGDEMGQSVVSTGTTPAAKSLGLKFQHPIPCLSWLTFLRTPWLPHLFPHFLSFPGVLLILSNAWDVFPAYFFFPWNQKLKSQCERSINHPKPCFRPREQPNELQCWCSTAPH